jgi:hypothetical protein
MTPTYYHFGDATEIQAILRNGFTDILQQIESSWAGVYIADCPGEPDPDYSAPKSR